MSPWAIFEWALSVSLSIALVIAAIFGITIGVRYIVGLTSKRDWFKKDSE
jgi:hypothetical protein